MKPKANADYWIPKIEGNQRRDRDTDARLLTSGWAPFRVWEHEDMEAAAERLTTLVRGRIGTET